MGENKGFVEEPPRRISALRHNPKIAYFSMEIGIIPEIPSYAGGLGILAGDTIRSCADLKVPMVAITLLSDGGYFNQKIDEEGNQIETLVEFSPTSFLRLIDGEIKVSIRNKEVKVRPWCYVVKGATGFEVPIILLDTNIDGNGDWERSLTRCLYGGDERYRFAQEILLGVGGYRILRGLGFTGIFRFHMNEGHAALLTLELFNKTRNNEFVRQQCVFTTHTPVSAGHDQFDLGLVRSMLGNLLPEEIVPHVSFENKLNMTKLGLFFSRFINGVAKSHSEISRELFPGYSIDSITNGVHHRTWSSEPFKRLFDRHIPGWRLDASLLRAAVGIPEEEIWEAHMAAKRSLIDLVNMNSNSDMCEEAFVIGFARRQTGYKRPDLLISDPERLMSIAKGQGPIQIVYAGKAHPRDIQGKEIIRHIISAKKSLRDDVKIAFLENYDMELALSLVAGTDLWLNTPRFPLEASGTSGMKAALNAVPQLSTLDGWWVEGHLEDITGWSIGPKRIVHTNSSDDGEDMEDMYHKLEHKILPMFYADRQKWIQIMRNCIAINASFFHTQRMVEQYVVHAYFL